MKRSLRDEWVAALRSGVYKQGRGCLSKPGDDVGGCKHCCLGVLAEIHPPLHSAGFLIYPDDLLECGEEPVMTCQEMHQCMHWNDSDGKSFEEIADLIMTNIAVEED